MEDMAKPADNAVYQKELFEAFFPTGVSFTGLQTPENDRIAATVLLRIHLLPSNMRNVSVLSGIPF